jgi:hypothetical protein
MQNSKTKHTFMTIEKCPFTGFKLDPNEIKPVTGPFIEYETPFVGKVKITFPAYEEIRKNSNKYLIAGICLSRTIQHLEPLLIDSNFIRLEYKKEKPPEEFDEKCFLFLRNLYLTGGNENKSFRLQPKTSFALAYASPDEFVRIIDHVASENYITIGNVTATSGDSLGRVYNNTKMTTTGRTEALKSLPKLPMFSLISQNIRTGNKNIDDKINHAREMFFSEPVSIDKMRTACETLSYVLEPLRTDLNDFFNQKDIQDFFHIVNSFDIRHNKESTKNLIYQEQFEWIFYSLLNTITTYVKLKALSTKPSF